MLDICTIGKEEWKIFIVFFKVFFINYKEYWIMNNDIFKKVLISKFNA